MKVFALLGAWSIALEANAFAGHEVTSVDRIVSIAAGFGADHVEQQTTELGPWLGRVDLIDSYMGGISRVIGRSIQSSGDTQGMVFSDGDVLLHGVSCFDGNTGWAEALTEHVVYFQVASPVSFSLVGDLACQWLLLDIPSSGRFYALVEVGLTRVGGPRVYAETFGPFTDGSSGDEVRCIDAKGILPPGDYELRFSADLIIYSASQGENRAPKVAAQHKVRFLLDDANPPPLKINSSDPANGAIDAREEWSAQSETSSGAESVRVVFSNAVVDPTAHQEITTGNFRGFDTDGRQIGIKSIERLGCPANAYLVVLDDPVAPGAWTTIITSVADPSGTPIDTAPFDRVTIGFLPGDVNGDGTSSPSDILDLIDNLNHVRVPALHEWQCDIDRSELCAPADILREIDLLNGARTSRVWNGVRLPPRP